MKKFVLFESRKVDFTANAKVNTDVIRILKSAGFVPRRLQRFVLPLRGTQRILAVCWFVYARLIMLTLTKGSDVVLQYPNGCAQWERYGYDFFCKLAQKTKLVLLVQDLDVPRFAGDVEHPVGSELVVRMAGIASKVIVHNAVMRKWFAQRGISDGKIVELLTFDYLASTALHQARFSHVVTIVGNLAPNKAAYAEHLREILGVQWRLFSPYFDERTMGGPGVSYAGVCPSEVIPKLLNYGFGLVWDGDSVDSCVGNAGKYTLMVAPHKLALYLSSGLPVIVSEAAACADIVRKYDVGLIVRSLRDLPDVLSKVSETRYHELSTNAFSMAHKLREGYFTKRAVMSALTEVAV